MRDKRLDAVRGFAILLVMMGHCIVLNHMADPYVYDAIKAVQMPLFMAISGLLAGKNKQIQSGKELGREIGKRGISCLVPFVSWIFVTNVSDFPAKLVRVLYQPDTGLWFLLTLFLLSVLLDIALFVRDGWHAGWIGFDLVIVAEAILLAVYYVSGNTLLGPALLINYFPFFMGGFFVGNFWEKAGEKAQLPGRKRTRNLGMWSGWLFGACLFAFLVARFDMVYANNRLEWLIQLAASALGTVVCFMAIYQIPTGRLQSGLAYVGCYTLEIYVLHFRFARILGMQDAGLSLYSRKGLGVVLGTFCLMSGLTTFFILVLKQLAVTDFLLFGKRHPNKGRGKKTESTEM